MMTQIHNTTVHSLQYSTVQYSTVKCSAVQHLATAQECSRSDQGNIGTAKCQDDTGLIVRRGNLYPGPGGTVTAHTPGAHTAAVKCGCDVTRS